MSLNQSTLHSDTNACATAQRRLQGMAHLIGNTPLLAIDFTFKGTERTIFAKCEQMNLTGSIKDRMVYHILKTAYASGQIHAGDTIVEVSSGNTGISCAAIGAAMGHPVVIFMPDWMSAERVQLIASYGAQVVTVSREQGGFMACLRMSEEYAATHPNVSCPVSSRTWPTWKSTSWERLPKFGSSFKRRASYRTRLSPPWAPAER
jgi:cysteine synthase A